MKKFILLIASIFLLLSAAVYSYHDKIAKTKLIKWEYEISNSFNNKKHKIRFEFEDKTNLIGNRTLTLTNAKFKNVKSGRKELDEYYKHLKEVITNNIHKTLLNKFDILKLETKKVYFDDHYVEVYSDNEVKAIDWTYNKQLKEYDVTLQTINDFKETYKYGSKNNYKYVKIEKNNLSLELKLTKFEYQEG